MNYWLVKSEPFKYSWDQFESDGETTWDGIRNYQARNNLGAMKRGDQVLFYHSNEGLEVTGIAKVSKQAFQDPTSDDPRWLSVKLKPVKKLKYPVSLKAIKAEPELAGIGLVRLGRLSVCGLTEKEFRKVVEMGKKKVH